MQITYIFRDPHIGGKSIEEIFHRIGNFIKNEKDIVANFYYQQSKNWFSNAMRLLLNNTSDIFHITGDVQFLALFLLKKKLVLTIHDIGHYKNLSGLKKWLYGLLWIRLPLLLSNKITTVSTYTKEDIIKYFKVSPQKIVVIPNPVPVKFKPSPFPRTEKKPRVLQVGTAENKNLEGVCAALEGIECQLIIIGKLSDKQILLLQQYHIDYNNLVNISYEEVYDAYCSCHMVIFATFHEGFGMPVIEAQAVGRPIICSRICSLPEVAGDGAHFINPKNKNEIREGVLKIIHNENYQNELIQKGIVNVKRFEMENIAKAYNSIYSKL